jgi:hypothetical protein
MQSSPEVKVGPRHYFESVDDKLRGEHATRQPVCGGYELGALHFDCRSNT